jgi:pyruvate,water dikinase
LGLSVPSGFCVTTKAYFHFIKQNEINDIICSLLKKIIPDDNLSLENISGQIRKMFENSEVPRDLYQEIMESYHSMKPFDGTSASYAQVAVRSSATAEDLPEFSFAGQQDTYLNVTGDDEIIRSVKKCWGSLWSSRAIQYRIKNRIDESHIALAVIIQNMIPGETSGVMFTANPFNGRLNETVIESTSGLCEALVSGQINPDYFIVDRSTKKIIEKTINDKSIESGKQSDMDALILQLSEIGEKAAIHFDHPQDMEWSYYNGNIHFLQSRPITVKMKK